MPENFSGIILRQDHQGLSLQLAGQPGYQPTHVDFQSPKLAHRVQTSRRNQGLLKAVGLGKYPMPLTVLDATAGMGTDAWVLAAFGCEVRMLERSPLMAALLRDGQRRALTSPEDSVRATAQRLSLALADAKTSLAQMAGGHDQPDVIYLDPMFPARRKSAKVKKDMALMQQLLPVNDDIDELLALALAATKKRVVLKRPGKSEKQPLPNPDFQVPGKACHFQVFLIT